MASKVNCSVSGDVTVCNHFSISAHGIEESHETHHHYRWEQVMAEEVCSGTQLAYATYEDDGKLQYFMAETG